MSAFRQMLSAGLLSVDLGKISGVRLTEISWEVLKGKRNVFFRKDLAYSKAQSDKQPSKTTDLVFEGEESQQLFETLRKLRLDIARQLNVPPYVIFHDKSLKEMALIKPSTVNDFLRITGVGESKAQRYSEVFIDCICGKKVDLSRYIGNIQKSL
jgi:ATP-dependent DNA helicase RecQ